jgi:hypothetical protein
VLKSSDSKHQNRLNVYRNKAARFAAPDIEREDPRFHCEGGGVYQLVQNRDYAQNARNMDSE